MPRPSWRRYSRKPPALAMRSTASRSWGPQSQRWLPNTSPVRHSLCGRTSGTALRGRGADGAAPKEPSPNARCSRPSTRPWNVYTRAVVAYPSGNSSGTVTWVRTFAARIASSMGLLASPGLEPVGQRVPQQHDVPDLPYLCKRRAPVGIPREPAVADEAPGPGVADEERRDHEVELVGQIGGEELGVHRPTPLDHQPVDPARVQVLGQPVQVDRLTAVDHGRHPAQAFARVRDRGARAVDELVGVAGGEEVGAGVELGPAGHGYLERQGR